MATSTLWLAIALFLGHAGQSGANPEPVQPSRPPFPEKLLPARSIGPSSMGGRITDIALDPSNAKRWVVGAATGGVWITDDAGVTWQNPFDSLATTCIGAVAINPSRPQELWAGTGEANARNSVSQGLGVYLSTDGGKQWTHKGLTFTRHIGRIVVDPADGKRVFVAALGPLWKEGGQRGLFLTEDAGTTWKQVLPIPSDVGCIDVRIDPHDVKTMLACAYRVRRDGFSGGNPSQQFSEDAGLYLSSDRGKTWRRVTEGLPTNQYGRCGVDFDASIKGRVLATIQTEETDLSVAMGQNFTEAGKPVGSPQTGGVFESLNGGQSWKKINDLCPRPFYFSQVRAHPGNAKKIWVLGIPLYSSNDAGKTFRSDITSSVHPDHHAMVIDPKNPQFALLGNDGGLYSTKDWGRTWTHHNNMVLSQFYAIDTDKRTPYRVMGGLQDNGSWVGLSRTGRKEGVLPSDWSRLFGADGFQVRQDPNTAHLAFLEMQYGGLRRHDFRIGLSIEVKPRPAEKDPPYRFNWNSPVLVSRHRPNTIYFGGNHLFRSTEKGANWKRLGPDLTRGKPGPGAESPHTLLSVAEDRKDPTILWTGSDDGLLHISRDDGNTWTEVGQNLPVAGLGWVTSIHPLESGPGHCVVSFDRQREGDDRPYLFSTTNGGKSWVDHSAPLEPFGAIHDYATWPQNPRVAFASTERGLAMTLDGGTTWYRHPGIPSVPVHEVAFATTTPELALGTHGRGAWIVDLSYLSQLVTPPRDFALLEPPVFARLAPQKSSGVRPSLDFLGENPPHGVRLWVHLPREAKTGATILVKDKEGKEVLRYNTPAQPGFHSTFLPFPLRGAAPSGEKESGKEAPASATSPYRVIAEFEGKTLEREAKWRDIP